MAHNESNHRFDGDEAGTFMKQESVMSLYEPTPMTPTQTSNKSISSATLLSPDSPNHAANGEMKRNASYGNLGNQPEARVLVLYTGGTIGMLRNDKNGEQSASNWGKLISHAMGIANSKHVITPDTARQKLLIICFHTQEGGNRKSITLCRSWPINLLAHQRTDGRKSRSSSRVFLAFPSGNVQSWRFLLYSEKVLEMINW